MDMYGIALDRVKDITGGDDSRSKMAKSGKAQYVNLFLGWTLPMKITAVE